MDHRKKIGIMVIGAAALSLVLGTPIALLKAFIFELEIVEDLGRKTNELLSTYFTLIVNIVIIVIFVNLAIKYFVKNPIQKFIKGIEEVLADGQIDLTKRVELKTNDETRLLADYFNKFLDELSLLTGSSGTIVNNISSSTTQLNSQAGETGVASKQVAAAMSELSAGVAHQSERTNEIVSMMQETKILAEKAGNHLRETGGHADAATNSAVHANQVMQEALTQLNELNDTVQASTDAIHKLGQKSDEIGNIVEVIAEIANQTHLLSLNASIEAARAGEHGQGFAVVANQVKKLSEQTRLASAQVAELIKSIQDGTRITVESMENNLHLVGKQSALIQNGCKSVGQIVEETAKTDVSVKELHEIIHVVESHTNGVLAAVEEISSVIEQSSASLQEVTASSDQQSDTVTQMVQQIDQLDHLSKSLQGEISKFKVS